MTTKIITPKTPAGTLELLPRAQAAFQAMLDAIRASYERHGFTAIETPVFEEADILLTKSGGETEKQVYFAQSTGGRAQGHEPGLALRFDLTVPLARYVAQHEHELAFPFRRYQIQRVYRGERAQKGRFREFYQCDIDIIGKDALSPAYDAEAPVVIADIFRELSLGAFTIHVSNRKILKGYLEKLGADENTKTLALREIDKAAKTGWDSAEKNILALGLPAGPARALLGVLKIRDADNDVLARELQKLCAGNALAEEGLREISLLLRMTADMGADGVIRFNPAITRGLDYYTGTVYETFLAGHEGFGSVCSGGRYDNLASHYTKSRLPGVGISIGATRLFDQMRQAGLVQEAASPTKILVCRMEPDLEAETRKLATSLRAAGLNTALYLEDDKLGRQIKYADRSGIPHILVLGRREKEAGIAALKNLKTGAQKELPLEGLGKALHAALRENSGS